MCITVNGKRVDLSIKESIDQESWNVNKGLAKGNKAEIHALNEYLEKVRAKIVHHYQEMILTGKMITAVAIKNKFLGMDRHEFTLCGNKSILGDAKNRLHH